MPGSPNPYIASGENNLFVIVGIWRGDAAAAGRAVTGVRRASSILPQEDDAPTVADIDTKQERVGAVGTRRGNMRRQFEWAGQHGVTVDPLPTQVMQLRAFPTWLGRHLADASVGWPKRLRAGERANWPIHIGLATYLHPVLSFRLRPSWLCSGTTRVTAPPPSGARGPG
ncbi:hypothetical protein GCM10009733_032650 [Nonomuraea maheshkhaliensis]|uniref:Uncharacterized protein n=1 Tax=Nonomuraea maheshkhaliensis TaxID=419590 RepID=A0ABN2F6P1_9ACTN